MTVLIGRITCSPVARLNTRKGSVTRRSSRARSIERVCCRAAADTADAVVAVAVAVVMEVEVVVEMAGSALN